MIKGKRAAARGRAAGGGGGGDGEAPPNSAALSIEVGEAAAAGDDEFVPEEEEEGPATQGDHLMMAKAKMRRQRGIGSPGLDSPGSPVRAACPSLALRLRA